ncbi:hypothetical protein GLP37_01710 [Photobacterium phosphoreum]|uniref:DUF5666 domain-containing protein n=1 Tax=Photobacterium phosphoreum TaxID=659 RepID=UPI001E5789D4|nr:DUF5666 domain-containing protein [Photobacterium phosphoreum]MCD9500909.1 hypothetical protein [Photobacterium phosphoreum]
MKKITLATLIGLVLTGCGGGGGDDSTAPQPPVETKPTIIEGTIDKVQGDNVTVNGRSYHVLNVKYADAVLSEGVATLQPKMVVQISETTKSGADVFLDPTLLGQISKIDDKAKTFVVNGVSLMFSGFNTEIKNNDWVMVSALPMATDMGIGYNVLSVIKVEQEGLYGESELEGVVANLTDTSFSLGPVTISYDPSLIEDAQNLQDGDWVEVTGHMSDTVFIASEVEVDNYDDNAEFDNAEIEGVVTWINKGQTKFELNARGQFTINNTTLFDDGTLNDLVVGKLVEVTVIDGIAKEIEFDNESNGSDSVWGEFEEDGRVTMIDGSMVTIDTMQGEKTFYIDGMTHFEDGLKITTLMDQSVEVEGVIINGKKIAREIEREDD